MAITNRNDTAFITQIPNFITQAINDIMLLIKELGVETIASNTTAFLTQNNQLLAKPNSWRQTISMTFIDTVTATTIILEPRSYEFCVSYWPNPTFTGTPKFYANYSATEFYIVPTPVISYAGTLIYLSLPEVTVTAVNDPAQFIMNRYESLTLYGSLIKAFLYLNDDQRIQVFKTLYNESVQSVNNNNTRTIIDRTTKRDAN